MKEEQKNGQITAAKFVGCVFKNEIGLAMVTQLIVHYALH